MRRALVLALAVSFLGGHAASAQSLLGSRGLGMPLEPLDARARGLGSVGIGLWGSGLLPSDPAASAGLLNPSIQITVQPQWGTGTLNGVAQSTQATRFPLIGLGYPVPVLRGAATLTFGGLFDQRWEFRKESTTELGGVTLPVTDRFISDGGVSTVQVSWAQVLGEDLAVAAGVGTRTGSVTRTFTRVLDSVGGGVQVAPFRQAGTWQYSGLTGNLGARWSPTGYLSLAGSMSWSSTLKAEPSDATEGDRAEYDTPLVLRFGASGLLTPQLSMTVGLSYSDWEGSASGLDGSSVVGAAWSFGGGLEWIGTRFAGRNLPLRVGVRRSDLPFTFEGAAPTETIVTGGFGLNLARTQDMLGGGLDVAVERGTREGGPYSETFWRGSLTFRVASW